MRFLPVRNFTFSTAPPVTDKTRAACAMRSVFAPRRCSTPPPASSSGFCVTGIYFTGCHHGPVCRNSAAGKSSPISNLFADISLRRHSRVPTRSASEPCPRFLLQYRVELACNAGDVAKAYLNQHWIPGSPRRPALVQSWAGLPARDSLKAGAGHPLIRGVQGLVTHGGVDRS